MSKRSVVYLKSFLKGNHRWQDLLEDFLNFKGAEGKSDRTLLDYRKIVSLFLKRHPNWNYRVPMFVYCSKRPQMR